MAVASSSGGPRRATEADLRQIAAWNATEQRVPEDLSVPQLVTVQAAAAPHAAALVASSDVVTYGELDARADRLARHLQFLGVGPDVPVGLVVRRSTGFVVGALAILKTGGAYVPLDPAYPLDRLDFMLQDAQPPVVVTDAATAPRLPRGAWRVITLEDAPRHTPGEVPASSAVNSIGPTHLAYVIYTSGSTGRPKGVQITHESLINLVAWHQRAFAITRADRATFQASPGFDAAVWELWPYLTAGASVYLPDESTRVVPEELRDWMVTQGITVSFVPTALAEPLLALEWPSHTALRTLLTGADTLHCYPSPALPFAVVNNYGPTESTVVATSGPVSPGARPDTLPPIGRPIANTQIHILDEQLQPVPIGTPGEMYIGGAGLARGYLNRADLTAEKFIANPFSAEPGARLYRTGDLARWLPDGQIAFVGRSDEQVKIRGYRIELDEIVSVLDRHPAVRASVVVAREDATGEKRLVAYVVPGPGEPPTPSSLLATARTTLPDYMLPSRFVRLDALPLTANGKVERSALPAPDATNTLRDDAFEAPRTVIEARLAGILTTLLAVEHVGAQDNFFLLGGHSLLGTQVISRVRDTFGVELPLRSVFDTPTVAELSAEIERRILTKLELTSDGSLQ